MVEKRANTAIGNTAQIMALLKDISLGHNYFKIAKILREAMMTNSMLFSSAGSCDIFSWVPLLLFDHWIRV